MRLTILTIAALVGTVVAASAQINDFSLSELMSERTNARGVLFNRDLMTISDMVNLSQTDYSSYNTARSAGLSGAVTALGADASVMSVNPAGLGMYRSNEFSITFADMMGNTLVDGGSQTGSSHTNKFAVGNLSFVANLYQSGVTPVTAVNFGFAYNRTANFNQQYSVKSVGASSSVANMFSRQLTSFGVSLNELYGSNNPDWSYMPSNLWGAALGYKTGLTFQDYGDTPDDYYTTDPDGTESSNYRDPITSGDVAWSASWIPVGSTVDQYMTYVSEGSANEYDFSLGANLGNKLYFGTTIGIQSIYQRIDIYYNESYNSTSGSTTTPTLEASSYNQTIITRGAGINAKFGLTYRSGDLRVGLAYHTPTSISYSREYQASVAGGSTFTESDGTVVTNSVAADSPVLEDSGSNRWVMNSPQKLLLGVAYTFNNRALISADYQVDFYKSMKMKSTPTGVSTDVYSGISSLLNNVNNVRVGAEYKLTPITTLRGGYSFSTSVVNDSAAKSAGLWDIPVNNSYRGFSAGIGFMMSTRAYFDISYTNQLTTQSEYAMFYAEGTINSNAPSAESAQSIRLMSKIREQNILATFRFYM
ncbi:MAG: hypothetical protein SNH63_00130 [Rikenellaceae bacterium]